MTNTGTSSLKRGTAPQESSMPSEALQLSKLSSILNGLENGASLITRHLHDAMRSVRAGTYRVDPMQLSRRIVGEAMRSA